MREGGAPFFCPSDLGGWKGPRRRKPPALPYPMGRKEPHTLGLRHSTIGSYYHKHARIVANFLLTQILQEYMQYTNNKYKPCNPRRFKNLANGVFVVGPWEGHDIKRGGGGSGSSGLSSSSLSFVISSFSRYSPDTLAAFCYRGSRGKRQGAAKRMLLIVYSSSAVYDTFCDSRCSNL